jgi:F0F1-type ATP synthase assembly protein I
MDEPVPPRHTEHAPRSGRAPNDQPQSEPTPWRLVGLGGQFLVALLAGDAGGAGLDRRFGVGPWGMLGGLLFAGLVFARLVRPFLRDDAGGNPPSSPPSAGP